MLIILAEELFRQHLQGVSHEACAVEVILTDLGIWTTEGILVLLKTDRLRLKTPFEDIVTSALSVLVN